MIIASIDLQDKKVVQLKQGESVMLERDDAAALASEFDMYGETAVIDIDAAKGTGSNLPLIKPLLRKASCRVGGGIRNEEQAAELVSLGAEKIIAGSAVFRLKDGGFGINKEFLERMARRIGRERLIIAVDSRDGMVVADGWKTSTGLPLLQTAAALAPFAGELLWTCVEREGTMSGIDIETAKELRSSLNIKITAAGGVSTLKEIEALSKAGCDIQLGMALYTGKISLADAFSAALNWEKTGGLVPVIAQDTCGQVLMMGFTGKEALAETFKRRNLCFHSRTRDRLWMKGENSGNTLKVIRLRADCDYDTILATVEPAGPACHTRGWSCFETGRRYTHSYLQKVIDQRLASAQPGSYTASLTGERVRRKINEEAYEVCTAKNHDEIVWEVADLFYHSLALLSKENIRFEEVLDELDRRHKK
jgi:phosphoribosyl-ATP pyrophosphohydrolase/phosphoribosyl-AMP cyclohydrolase